MRERLIIVLLIVVFSILTFFDGIMIGYKIGYCSAIQSEYKSVGCIKDDKIIYIFN